MLSTVQNINYWFSMDNCSLKASKSYKKYYKFAKEVLWIPTQMNSQKQKQIKSRNGQKTEKKIQRL